MTAIRSAAQAENITVVFINNANSGTTSSQMAATTLAGMKTKSSPTGRDVETHGYLISIAEMLA